MVPNELDLSGYVLLPAPAEPHAHLDKALTAERVKVQAGDLGAAIEAWHEHRRTLDVHDIAERAERAARLSLRRGVTAMSAPAWDVRTVGARSPKPEARSSKLEARRRC